MGIVFKLNCVFLFIFILAYPIIASDENTYVKAETIKMIKDDSPLFGDLSIYVPVMTRILEYCERNKRILSLNLVHGLFLVNGELNSIVKKWQLFRFLQAFI